MGRPIGGPFYLLFGHPPSTTARNRYGNKLPADVYFIGTEHGFAKMLFGFNHLRVKRGDILVFWIIGVLATALAGEQRLVSVKMINIGQINPGTDASKGKNNDRLFFFLVQAC